MIDRTKRRCAECNEAMSIVDRNNIDKILRFKKQYYHIDCFKEMATRKLSTKKGRINKEIWEDALNNIEDLRLETQKTLEYTLDRDDLNDYLCSTYNISTFPDTFWTMIADLEYGIYKNKKCKPIKMNQLLSLWKWGQKKLDKIALKNEMNHRGPSDNLGRVKYDLSILLTHTGDFEKYQMNIKSQEMERNINQKETTNIDYNKIKSVSHNNGLDDISDLLDDLI